MAKFYDAIPDDLIQWIGEQPIFFVASAPLAAERSRTPVRRASQAQDRPAQQEAS